MSTTSKSELVAGILIALTCAGAAAQPAIPLPNAICQTPTKIGNWASSILNPTHTRTLSPPLQRAPEQEPS